MVIFNTLNITRARPILFAAVAFCACSTSLSSAPGAASTSDPSSANNLQATASQGGYLEQPDPKHRGWLLWTLTARNWVINSPDKAAEFSMDTVLADLYQNGKPAATLAAPHATGDTGEQIIVATGRVTVTSLVQTGTSIVADTVKWSARSKEGVATGHVIAHDGRSGMVIHTDKLYFNTTLKRVWSSSGYNGTIPN